MLVQGCCIQMDLGHPLSVRDTAVSDVLSSLLLLPYGTNESFPPPHRTVSSVGEGGVFLSVHKVFKEMKMCSSVHMWFSDITSEQQSSWWFVISFCLKRGKNDFQFNILKCWDFRIQREYCEKVKDTVKERVITAVLFLKLVKCWNVYFFQTRTRYSWSICYRFLPNMFLLTMN